MKSRLAFIGPAVGVIDISTSSRDLLRCARDPQEEMVIVVLSKPAESKGGSEIPKDGGNRKGLDYRLIAVFLSQAPKLTLRVEVAWLHSIF